MIVLQNVQRNRGHFMLQVGEGSMEIVLPCKTSSDIVFPVNRESAKTIVNGIVKLWVDKSSQHSVFEIVHVDNTDLMKMGFAISFNSSTQLVHFEISVVILKDGRTSRLPFVLDFRISEVNQLQKHLELYWRIFLVPSIGDYISDALRNGWPDHVLWDFPEEAVSAIMASQLKNPESWKWENDDTIVVANDDHKTWYAIHFHDGKFAWLTKTFD